MTDVNTVTSIHVSRSRAKIWMVCPRNEVARRSVNMTGAASMKCPWWGSEKMAGMSSTM